MVSCTIDNLGNSDTCAIVASRSVCAMSESVDDNQFNEWHTHLRKDFKLEGCLVYLIMDNPINVHPIKIWSRMLPR